jgi:hypothetical protein
MKTGRPATRYRFSSCRYPSGMGRRDFQSKDFAGQVSEGCRARQVRFMSTQKRVNRSQPKECMDRVGAGCIPLPGAIARYVSAAVNGRTAPLLSILWSAMAWVATKFLQSDYPTRQLVRPVFEADRRGSPPPRAGCRAALGKQASPRSSIPRIPYPSGPSSIHPALPQGAIAPQAPDGESRRAERYDGKRDMHFQHAA